MTSLPDLSLPVSAAIAVGAFGAMAAFWAASERLVLALPEKYRERAEDVCRFLFAGKLQPAEAFAFVVIAECVLAVVMITFGLSAQAVAIALVVIAALPAFAYYRAQNQRAKDLELALPMALQQVANEMAAGATIETALKKVTETAPKPADIEIRRLLRRVEVKGVDIAFAEMSERLDSRSFALMASVVRIGTSSGGELVSALKNLSRTLIEIERLNRKIRTAGENGRRNLYLMTAVGPLVAAGSFMAVDHQTTVMDDPFGQVLIGLAILLAIAAHVAGYSMTRVKV